MVDGAPAGNNFGLAPRVAAERDQFRRWAALLLDGRHICSPPFFRPKTRLLFDEHVERVCALGSRGLGPDPARVARCRCDRGGSRRFSSRCWSIVCRGRAYSKRKLGIMDARWTAWKALNDMPASAWLAVRAML